MNWSRSWSKFCESGRIVPSSSRSASGPWCWVGRSVMFLFDCWLAGWLIHLQPWVLDGQSVMFLFDCWPVDRPYLEDGSGGVTDVVAQISGAVIRLYAGEGELPGYLDQGDLIREGRVGVGVWVALPDGRATPRSLSTMHYMVSSLSENIWQS
ncbi:hypothetical protein DY000_02014328 [Brassica cretica]|uniref:Uncharacterized protein n=1 Tax=Brassica cretica TaxID=69181 RepID=A0ABQ7CX31_BRACR|nr:hypothetical protein DY000_02014328 [Brassica cretica]